MILITRIPKYQQSLRSLLDGSVVLTLLLLYVLVMSFSRTFRLLIMVLPESSTKTSKMLYTVMQWLIML